MTPVTITVIHPTTLSAATILALISGIVNTDAPVVINALPISSGAVAKIAIYTSLAELGLEIAAQIAAAIAAAHAAAIAPAQATSLVSNGFGQTVGGGIGGTATN